MVSLLLFIIWGLYFLAVKKYMVSGYVYFAMLAFMLLPPNIASESLHEVWYHDVDYLNIIVFVFFPFVKFHNSYTATTTVDL